MEIPEIDIKKKLKEISERGFIRALRKSDTGIGFTLETEMGINENNLKNEDFTYKGEKIELKAQRKETTSNITLFTKEPVKGKIGDRQLIEKYGYKNGHGRRALKITLTIRNYTPQEFPI
ncbi:MAG: MvaI/BcnI family restriction endonuclease [Candidatus Aenigmarchaeota archaeon]|nr:MvaI/BcnI family restriction endonuclease [Candidatus Aenigmarchaeota archaeon]MDI6722332.1 MvaI/BcnI family restriction endonuclease [Candidatus Aenigmarchaeota archaeon]